mgnify:CR=1 FL=1
MGGGDRGKRTSYVGTRSNYERGIRAITEYEEPSRKRVFISFHVDDEAQVDLLRHQASDDRFDLEFVDYSVKEPFDEAWKSRCTERINQSSVVVVMIGPETHTRAAVNWEIEKAYELGKPVVGVRIYRDENHTIPEPMVRNVAKIVNWNMEEIQNAINKSEYEESKLVQ